MTEKAPDDAGLPEPEYRTVEFMVFATLKNHKWVENHRALGMTEQEGSKKGTGREQDTEQVAGQDETQNDVISIQQNKLLEFCREPRSRKEMQEYIGIASRVHFSNNYLNPLLNAGKIRMTIPDKPSSKHQKYVTV